MAQVTTTPPGLLSRGDSLSSSSRDSKSLPVYVPSNNSAPAPPSHVMPQPRSMDHVYHSQQPSRPGPSSVASTSDWSPSVPRVIRGCSQATLDNARYQLNEFPRQEHDNEDRSFAMEKDTYKVFGVFDGHDGSRAVGFASNYLMELFDMDSWKKLVEHGDEETMLMFFSEAFKAAEKDFFKSIARDIELKEIWMACIPDGLSSYKAQLQYPMEVAELQKLEPRITGGCTAVLAVIANKKLYVANVGDSRAVIIRERPGAGTLYAQQLSVDHGVENEEELSRLERLGLSRENLKRAGRLGTQENTRSIGDYYIKSGYKNVDTLASAREAPGIAEPHIATPIPIDDSFKYLVLMTDGIYKSIEGMFEHEGSVEGNKVLAGMIQREDAPGSDPSVLADHVIARLSKIHAKTFQDEAARDPRSTKAVNCRKRDDMTCVIYKFPPKAAPRRTRPSTHTQPPPYTVQESQSAPSSLQTDFV